MTTMGNNTGESFPPSNIGQSADGSFIAMSAPVEYIAPAETDQVVPKDGIEASGAAPLRQFENNG